MANQGADVRKRKPEMRMEFKTEERFPPDDGLVEMLVVRPVHVEEGVQPIRGDACRQLQLP